MHMSFSVKQNTLFGFNQTITVYLLKQQNENNFMIKILKIVLVEHKAVLRDVGDFGANELVRV